jgi:hypothetical protein
MLVCAIQNTPVMAKPKAKAPIWPAVLARVSALASASVSGAFSSRASRVSTMANTASVKNSIRCSIRSSSASSVAAIMEASPARPARRHSALRLAFRKVGLFSGPRRVIQLFHD